MGLFDGIINSVNTAVKNATKPKPAYNPGNGSYGGAGATSKPKAPYNPGNGSYGGAGATSVKAAPAKSSTSSSSSRSSGGSGNYSSGGGSSYSGGGSSGGGGGEVASFAGGGGGGDFSAAMAAPAPVMQDIVIPDAEADTGYQNTVKELARALADFDAQQKLGRSQYDFGFNDAKRRMGWDDGSKRFDRNRPGAFGEAMYANENDFAGRGLLWSGLMGEANSDINREFADRITNLDTARQDNVDTQNQARGSFVGAQDATKQTAKQNAVSQIAAQLGISLDQVPTGTGSKTIQRQVV